uniref:Uncharacterized protein n=1 Tax=Oryza brachyantha TaxID=4533 RepID=J3N442_ORYBR
MILVPFRYTCDFYLFFTLILAEVQHFSFLNNQVISIVFEISDVLSTFFLIQDCYLPVPVTSTVFSCLQYWHLLSDGIRELILWRTSAHRDNQIGRLSFIVVVEVLLSTVGPNFTCWVGAAKRLMEVHI